MMQSFKRALSALICGAMLLPLAACSSADGDSKTTSALTTTIVSPETEAVTTAITDTLLEPTDEYRGREFRVLERTLVSGTNAYYEAFTEGTNGDVINDAVYKRNGLIEDKYGVKVVSTVMTQKEMLNAIQKDVSAGDNNYDINMQYGGYTMQLALAGCLIDVNQLEHVDFTQEWWYADTMEETRIAGKNAFAVGDINNQSYTAVVAMFYNRTLGTQFEIEDPYQLVQDGKWTYEKMTAIGHNIATDLNGDGWDSEDRYTLAAANWAYQPFFFGQGGTLLSRDADGNPSLTALNEDSIAILENIIDLVNTEDYCWYLGKYSKSSGTNSTAKAFQNGQALFWPQLMVGAINQRNMEMDFGVLPLPKRDENQKEYISYLHTKTSLVSIPVTNTDLAFTGRILEDMACFSRRVVRPAFFDNLFDGIIARDEETTVMLDIIWSNVFMDLVQPLGGVKLSLNNAIRDLLDTNQKTVVSTFDRYRTADQAVLNSVIEAYQKMQ